MSPTRISTRQGRPAPKRISSPPKPVTLLTFAFYGHAAVIFRDGALVIGQTGSAIHEPRIRPCHSPPRSGLACRCERTLAQALVSNRRLAQSPAINLHARRRIEAVIAGLIDALDRLDGEPHREQTATHTRRWLSLQRVSR